MATPWLMMALLAAWPLGLLGLVWLLRDKLKRKDGLREAPSPPAYPILGHIPQMTSKSYHRQFCKWADELGPVYQLDVGGPFYVVSDASLVAPLLTRGPQYAPKAAKIYSQSYFASFDSHSIFNEHDDTDPVWQRVRKTMAVCFSTENVKKIFPQVLLYADKMMHKWLELIPTAPVDTSGGESQQQAVVAMNDWVPRCVLDTMGAAGFKVETGCLDNNDGGLLESIHEVLHEMSLRFANPLRAPLQKLTPFLASTKKVTQRIKHYNQLWEDFMAKMMARGPPARDDQTMGAAIIRLLEPSEDSPALPRAQVMANLATMVVAASDTSSSAISWALYNIASHRDVHDRCVRELAAAGLVHVAGRPAPPPLAWDAHASLPYLTATLKESMRSHTTAATGSARYAPTDMAIGGYHVPKGSIISIPFVTLHESNVNFTNPRVFDPTRWLQEPADKAPANAAGQQAGDDKRQQEKPWLSQATPTGNASNLTKSYLPFSDGPRSCVGQALANVTLRTMVISILARFQLSVHPDTGTPQEVEDGQIMATVMVSERPLKLIIRPHTEKDLI